MYKELIQTCEQNVNSLKSQIGLCESYIGFGDRRIKNKYNKQKTYLQTKLDEETFWYMKYVVLQKIFEDYGYTDTGVKDESIKYLYESITPEEVQECSQF